MLQYQRKQNYEFGDEVLNSWLVNLVCGGGGAEEKWCFRLWKRWGGQGCGGGPKRDEVTGEWRKMHSEELHNLYSSPDIIRQVKSR
jgi:hypothetical protein